jgi:hypothetical protein
MSKPARYVGAARLNHLTDLYGPFPQPRAGGITCWVAPCGYRGRGLQGDHLPVPDTDGDRGAAPYGVLWELHPANAGGYSTAKS